MSTTTNYDPARVRELEDALKVRMERMDAAVHAVKMEDGGVVVSSEQRDDFRSNLAEAREIEAEIKAMTEYGEMKAWLDAPAGSSVATAAAAAAGNGRAGAFAPQVKTIGEMFAFSEEVKEHARQGGHGSVEIEYDTADIRGGIGNMGQKDVYTALAPTYTTLGFGTTQIDPMVPRATRRARVRDLFPVAGTSANLIEFFRVKGFGTSRLDLTSSASTVAEYQGGAFVAKPHSNLTFEIDQAPVRTIAHWEAAHRNVLDDTPQLRSTIDNELLYGLRLAEDAQILNGTGSGNDLRGILNTPSIQTYSQGTVSGETALDALRRAATKVMLAYYEPTGYVVHPYDWEALELSKDTQGRYILATNVAMGAQQTVWRQPVVDTPAIAQKTFLTGAFGLGAQLYDRQIANIRVAEQHSDFFVRNAIVILAEERLALAVKRPESFVKGTLT